MTNLADPTQEIWTAILNTLNKDDRITPQLQGFLSLVEPRGVMAGTLYLEVPNDLTRGMLEQRIRIPLLNAIADLDGDADLTNFAIVVNPEISHATLEHHDDTDEQRILEPIAPAPAPESGRRSDTRLNPKYNFDNFVIGGSNRFA